MHSPTVGFVLITRFVYVDESKVAPFRIAATVVRAGDVAAVRRDLRRLLLPNQQRLHFKSEHDRRRRTHLRTMTELPVEVWLYEAVTAPGGEVQKRSACLSSLIDDLVTAPSPVRLFIENDQSVMRHDRSALYSAVAKHSAQKQVSYCHVAARDEPGLWISDGVAWCWPKGGTWRELARPLVRRVQQV